MDVLWYPIFFVRMKLYIQSQNGTQSSSLSEEDTVIVANKFVAVYSSRYLEISVNDDITQPIHLSSL